MEEIIYRDKEDIELIIEKIKFIWLQHPELRLGQLLCSCANYGALYYSQDKDLVKLLEITYKTDTGNVVPPLKTLHEDQIKAHEEEMKKMQELVETLQALKKPSANKGRVYIHRNGQVKSIAADDLQSYLKEGWEKGKGPRH